MNRRDFLQSSTRLALLGAAAQAAAARAAGDGGLSPDGASSESSAEGRIAAIIQAYDSQGNHRTATAGDVACAEWLRAELRLMGLDARFEEFALDRVDPQAGYLKVEDGRIDGVPVFDAAFSDAKGIRGRLGFLGGDADIVVVESDPFVLLEPQREQRSAVAEARASKHKAAVVLTRGGVPGIYLLNAISF